MDAIQYHNKIRKKYLKDNGLHESSVSSNTLNKFVMRVMNKNKDMALLPNIMMRVPREIFVPIDKIDYAFDNRPLNITGTDVTISQPTIVSNMINLLNMKELKKKNKGKKGKVTILELGTGSGYNLAILAEVIKSLKIRKYAIDSIEIIPSLVDYAYDKLGYMYQKYKLPHIASKYNKWPLDLKYRLLCDRNNIHHEIILYHGNASKLPRTSYNRIIVTAGGITIPSNLLNSLAINGIMIIPVKIKAINEEVLMIVQRHGSIPSSIKIHKLGNHHELLESHMFPHLIKDKQGFTIEYNGKIFSIMRLYPVRFVMLKS